MKTIAPATGVTRQLARYVIDLRGEDLVAHTIEHAKQALLDLIGIAVRASATTQVSASARRAVAALDTGGPATAIGYGATFAPQYAALLNGCNFHVLDFDDTHERSSLHPGAPVIGAALTAAEQTASTGNALITAIVAGYDVVVRIGLASLPGVHYARGFHPTATAGVFGATAAVARLRGDSVEVLESAFGINLSQSAGSLQFSVDGAQSKPLQVGFTAHNAILAREFAAAGIAGPSEALEGRSGFLHAYSDGATAAGVLDDWDGVHEIDRTAFKPYPCCRYMHAAIDTLAAIVREHHITPESVDRIRVSLPAAGMRLCAYPEGHKRNPQSIVDAQFSMYYAAAATVVRGSVRWDDYAQLNDPAIAALIERIVLTEDPEVEALFPRMAARVEIDAGAIHESRLATTPRGEPDDPLTWDDMIEKFNGLTAVVYSGERRNRIINLIQNLEKVTDIRILTAELGA
jgi:2-methylcitrate dehydratase PrpD